MSNLTGGGEGAGIKEVHHHISVKRIPTTVSVSTRNVLVNTFAFLGIDTFMTQSLPVL